MRLSPSILIQRSPQNIFHLGINPITGNTVTPFVATTMTSAKADGDSRTQRTGGRAISAGGLTASSSNGTDFAAAGLLQTICGNKWLYDEGFLHAIGGSSSSAMLNRSGTTNIDDNIATDSGRNPAYDQTLATNDAQWSSFSDAVYTVLTQPGNHIFSVSCGVNDTAAVYSVIHPQDFSITTLAAYFDAAIAAGKTLYFGNELPRGDSYYQMEVHSPAAGVSTVTNTTNFKNGDSFGDIGLIGWAGTGNLPVPLTKVTLTPGQNQYTLSGTVFTQGGTPLGTVWNNYNATPGGGRQNNQQQWTVLNQWYNSSASNFTSAAGDNYGVPGAQYHRPQLRIFDTMGALIDPTTIGTTNLPLPGTYPSDQLHPTIYAAALLGNALKTKIDADYSTQPSLEQRPLYNNWYACRANGVTNPMTGTLPPSMRVAKAGLISSNGVPFAKFDTSGTITGVTTTVTGTINFTTGAFSINMGTPGFNGNGTQIHIEQDIGNYDLVNFVEGTIGRNALMNGMMDTTAASGFNLPATTGVSTVTGITGSQVPYGWGFTGAGLNTAIAAGNAAVSTLTDTWVDGYPRWNIIVEGIHTATMNIQLQNSIANPGNRLKQNRYQSGFRQSYGKHPTNGHLYGTASNAASAIMTISSTNRWQSGRPSANTAITSLSSRMVDGASNQYISDVFLTAPTFNSANSDLYRLSPLVDMTGYAGGAASYTLLITNTANIPLAIQYGIGQSQYRSRSDI